MGAIVKAQNQKPIIINGMPDHVHIFLGQTPSSCLSNIVREIKSNSSNFINTKRLLPRRFSWQEGYGAFSYSHSHIRHLYNYIFNQEEHHKKSTFKEEYLSLLQRFDIEYKQEFLFDWID
jgi:REP element-mobilizing transposase RayT